MEKKRIRLKEKIRSWQQKFSVWITDVFSDSKKTFLFLGLFVFTLLFLIQLLVILISNGFYNGASDDVCQYYPIMSDFFNQIKTGTLTSFNLHNYFGASFFSDVYYIPLDIFTFIAFLLSYLMPFSVAYSSTELIKVFFGVMALAYYFKTQGMKNRTIFWMGIIYLISGGTACFMAFPAFLSMTFYLPFSLLVIHWFHQKKSWVVPLFVLALVLYNFYSAYMVIAFMSVMYVIESVKKTPFRIGKFLLDGFAFLSLILVGVVMSGILMIPTIQFILEDTYRSANNFTPWIVDIGPWKLSLFKPEIYIRILAKAFTEQRSVGFLGFLGDYKYEHVSLYITVIGLVFMNYVFFMKDRTSWIYKILILAGTVMMIFPFFSYLFSGTELIVDSPYTRWIDMIPLVQIVILAHVFDKHGFETMKMKWLTIPIVFMLATVAYVFYYYYQKLTSDATFSAKEALIAEAVFLGIAALYLVLTLLFGWFKKMKWIRVVFWVEFGLAIGYIYGASFYLVDRIDLFDDMESINVFLNESLDQDEFYRVYVDVDRFDVQNENFNRMTTFYTNTAKIFHSWTDAQTNEIGYLLFGANEAQEKKAMNVYTLYLNHVLGYKYLLLNAEYTYNLPSAFYTLVASDEQYLLYETLASEPFQVYESYLTYGDFKDYANTASRRFAAQKLLLLNVLLDEEARDYLPPNLESGVLPTADPMVQIDSFLTKSDGQLVTVAGVDDPTVREFYKYDNLDIDFTAGAIYIKSEGFATAGYGEVFMTFANAAPDTCAISIGTTHQVKCEFWLEPTAVYFEKTATFNEAKTIQYRMESAIDSAAYLVYDLSQESFSDSEGMLYFSFAETLDRVFVEDAEGNTSECIKGYCFFENPPVRLYIYKTNDMYQVNNLFNLSVRYGYDDLSYYTGHADSDLAANERLTIENGVIHLSYTPTSTTGNDQIVMVPVTYSEEWQFQSEITYSTLSVSGGFLGIVIPAGTEEVSLTLKFVPKGLDSGAKVTLVGCGLYAAIFILVHSFKVQRKKKTIIESEAKEK